MTDYNLSVLLLKQAGATKLGGKKHEVWELKGQRIPLSRGSKANPGWIRKLKARTT